jgi:hypothetical protein
VFIACQFLFLKFVLTRKVEEPKLTLEGGQKCVKKWLKARFLGYIITTLLLLLPIVVRIGCKTEEPTV